MAREAKRKVGTEMAGRVTVAILLSLFLVIALYGKSVAKQHVDLNLVIAIDCSDSVDSREFDLQIHGTAQAFTNLTIIQAIKSGRRGKIAVTVVEWSSATSQVVVVPWTIVTNEVDALRLAVVIKSAQRRTVTGDTSISAMIDVGTGLLATAPNIGDRNVIDISSDGLNNDGGRVDEARDRAIGTGITINGLPVLSDFKYLNRYFQNRIIGGVGAFVEIADNYDAFAKAIYKKLLREIMGNNLS